MRIKLFLPILLLVAQWSVQGQELLRKDPTRPNPLAGNSGNDQALGNDEAANNSDVQLSGIIIRPEYRIAILNGNRVREGENWQGYIIEKISRTQVSLLRDGEVLEVGLTSSINIKTVKDNEL